MRIITIGHSTSSNIYISSEYVSSNHAELLLMDNGDIFLTDKGSRNGTFLFGKRINPNQEIPVRRGDRIDFDNVPLNWSQVPSLPTLDPTKVKGVYGIGKNSRNKYILTGDTVSRFHATLKEMKNGKWFIQDHSTNGTFINGSRIPSNQDYQVKKGDAIVCGNVPLANPIRGAVIPIKPILAGVAAVAVICCLVLLKPWEHIKGNKGNDIVVINNDTTDTKREPPVTHKNIDPNLATVCVRCYTRIKVVFKDELDTENIKTEYEDWGLDNILKDELSTVMTGTAFFVSEDGVLLTNRHVIDIVYYMKSMYPNLLTQLKKIVIDAMTDLTKEKYWYDDDKVERICRTLTPSLIDFEAEPLFIGIAYPDRYYQSFETETPDINQARSELDGVIVEKKSDNDNIDVAILRTNNYKTPEQAQYFDLSTSIVKTETLNFDDEYCTMGYPGGPTYAFILNKHKMASSISRLRLKQRPGSNEIMFEGAIKEGQSGSAVYDKNKRLIGILTSGNKEDNVAIACPISHAIDLLKNVVEKDAQDKEFQSQISH